MRNSFNTVYSYTRYIIRSVENVVYWRHDTDSCVVYWQMILTVACCTCRCTDSCGVLADGTVSCVLYWQMALTVAWCTGSIILTVHGVLADYTEKLRGVLEDVLTVVVMYWQIVLTA